MNEMVRSLALPEVLSDRSPVMRQFGLLRIGEAMLAINVENIREVVPSPGTLSNAGIAATGLCGLLELRGSTIPVMDIRPMLGLPSTEAHGAVILVLRVARRLICIYADEVRGIATEDIATLDELGVARPAEQKPLVTHSFFYNGKVISVLAAESILALPGVPSVPEPVANAVAKTSSNAKPLLLFTCAAFSFGVAAEVVEATAPTALLRDTPMRTETCLGVIDHHGTQVPVLDTLRILGLGVLSERKQSSVLVLRYPDDRLLGFALDTVVDISAVPSDDIMVMPDMAMESGSVISGVYSAHGKTLFLLLDERKMMSDNVLLMFSRLSSTKPKTAAADKARGNQGDALLPYLVFRAGGDLATLVSDVREIVEIPKDYVALNNGGRGAMGLFVHRGTAIPLVSLGKRLGLAAVPLGEESRVLLVSDGPRTLGLVVDSLARIEMATRCPTAPDAAEGAERRLLGDFMVRSSDGRLLPYVDLKKVLI
jgi:purine-binding chemotaxis protein CheW